MILLHQLPGCWDYRLTSPYTAMNWVFALGCEGCVLAFSHLAVLAWSSPGKDPGHLTVSWSALLYHIWHMERFGRDADWHSSLPTCWKHTFPCPLLPAACMRWRFGWLCFRLPLYYDCFPFYKYYLNIMMRNKNKTKILKDERGKLIIHSSFSRNKRTKQFRVWIIDCSCPHRLAH